MKKRIILPVLLAMMYSFSFSQTITPIVIASEGGFYSSTQGSVSWTLGELSTETYSITSNYLTQGFQQPKLVFSTGVEGAGWMTKGEITAYPNPLSDKLVLCFNNAGFENGLVEIFAMDGTQLLSEKIQDAAMYSKQTISFSGFENGIYLLTVTNGKNNKKQSFRITKLN